MKSKKQINLEKKIKDIKQAILELGDIRPGSLSKQIAGGPNRKPRQYWQLSYTYKMRSRTDYIRDELVEQIQSETLEYKKFKKLMEDLIENSIQLSKEKIEIFKKLKNEN